MSNPHTLLPPINADEMLKSYFAQAVAVRGGLVGDDLSGTKSQEARRFMHELVRAGGRWGCCSGSQITTFDTHSCGG